MSWAGIFGGQRWPGAASADAARVVLALVVTALMLAGGHAYTAGAFSVAAWAALLVMLAVSLLLGSLLSLAFAIDDGGQIDFITALLLGMVALSSGLFLLGLFTPLSVSGNLAILALLGAGAAWRHRTRWQAGAGTPQGVVLVLDGAGLYALAVILVGAAGWSIENLHGLRLVAPGVYESHPWQDIFGHTTNVSRFMNPRGAASLGNEQFAGLPLPPYHYASYLLSSFVGRMGNLQAYALTASVLPMLGMVWTGMAAYAIGRFCGGSRMGAVAATGLMFIPDPSFWGLGHSWTGYFFFQQVGMGGLYGTATMGLGAALGWRAAQTGQIRPLIGAGAMLAATAFYKIQIVLVFGWPLAVVLLALQRTWPGRRRVAGAVLLFAMFLAGLSVLHRIPHAPTLGLSTEGAIANMRTILGIFPEPLTGGLLRWLPRDAPYGRVLLVGIPVILITVYGACLLVFAVAARLAPATDPNRRFLIALALSSLAAHLFVALCVAPNLSGRGDLFEIIHKPFVWSYFAVAVSASILVGLAWVSHQPEPWPARRLAPTAVGLLLAGTGVTFILGQHTQTALATSVYSTRLQMRADYVAAAEYLRTHTSPDAVVQYYQNDPIKMFTALTERKSFVILCEVNCGTIVPVAVERIDQLQKALNQPDAGAVRAAARVLGIDWVVIRKNDRAWQARPDAAPEIEFGDLQLYATAPKPPQPAR